MDLSQVIIKPVVTEKATSLSKDGVYAFQIHKDATKIDVKNAVRFLYGVPAAKVNIIYGHEKFRTLGRRRPQRKRHTMKRAIVTLKGRKTIDIFKPKI